MIILWMILFILGSKLRLCMYIVYLIYLAYKYYMFCVLSWSRENSLGKSFHRDK